MKTIPNTAKLLLLAAVLIASQSVSAQEKTPEMKNEFRIKVERDINGKKEKIDRTFATKEEMTAFINENNIDMPAIPDGPGNTKIKVCEKKTIRTCEKESTGKKITITEKEEGGIDGKTNLEIVTNDLTAEERATIIQALMNIKGSKIEMKQVKVEKENASRGSEPPTGLSVSNVGKEAITGLKLYPNPNQGQFHVSFSTGQLSDVTLRMTDISGKQVYSDIIKGQSGSFDKDIYIRPSLSQGTYLLEAEANGQKITTQVVVQ